MRNCKLRSRILQIARLQPVFLLLFLAILMPGPGSNVQAATRTWNGAGVNLGTGGTDLNLGLNWSGTGVLLPTDDLVINITGTANYILSLSANLTVNSVTISTTVPTPNSATSLIFSLATFNLTVTDYVKVTNSSTANAASRPYLISLQIGALRTLTIGGHLTCLNTSSSSSDNKISIDNSGSVIVGGTTTLNSVNTDGNSTVSLSVANSPANFTFNGNVILDNGTTVLNNSILLGSSITGSTGIYKFNGDLSIGMRAAMNPSFTAGSVIFDKAGVQNVSFSNSVYYFNIPNLVVGNTNSPTVNLSGSVPVDNIAGNLTINNSAILNVNTRQLNRGSNGGTFTMNGNSQLLLGGTSSVANGGGATLITSSNFPSGFTTTSFAAGSTVEYNAANTVNQTVYAPVTYGNLVLTNSTGSGSSIKSLASNISGIAGNLTINPFTTFDQSTFTANRTSAGGVLLLNANATLKLAGASGGQTGSNFPLNYSGIALNATSSTEYNAAATVNQTIYAAVSYGNLVLSNSTGSGNSNKILTANITGIAGNLTVNPFATFDQSTFTANRSSAGGVFTLGANAIQKLAGNTGGQTGSNFPVNFSSILLDATSTVDYNSVAGITQTVYAPLNYGNLNLTNSTGSGNSNKILAANITGIAGNLTINSFATFDQSTFTANRSSAGGTFTINANGNHKIAGATGGQTGSNLPLNFLSFSFNASATTEYNSAAAISQTIYAPVTYGNLILTNGTGSGNSIKNLASNVTAIAGNITVNSFTTFNQSTFTANRSSVGGTLTVNANAIHKLSGGSGGQAGSNFPLNFSTVTYDPAATAEYNGLTGVTQTIYGPVTYGHLILTNSTGSGNSNKILTANISGIAGNLTVNSFATFDQSTFTANRSAVGGAFALNANAVHKIGGASGGQAGSNFPLNFSSVVLDAASTTEYNSIAGINQTIYPAVTYGNLVLTNSTGSGNSNKLLASNVTGIAGNLSINAFVTFDQSTFTANRVSPGGLFTLAANAIHKLFGTAGGQAGSNFPNNYSSIALDANSTTEYSAVTGTSQTVFSQTTYGNLILSNSTGSGNAIKILTGNITGIAGNLSINSFATFDQSTFTANRSSAGGIFTLAASASYKVGGSLGGQTGSNFPLNFSSFSFNPASTTEYYSLSGLSQTIYAPITYGNLILTNSTGSGNANKLLSANIVGIAGDLTANSYVTLDPGTYTANRTVAGGVLTVNSNSSLKLAGNSGGQTGSNFPLNFSSVALNASSTVEYNSGAGITQTIYAPVTYGNLVLTNSTGSGVSYKVLASNMTGIAGNVSVGSFATFNQSTFTANRSVTGGVFTLAANAIHQLAGNAGGQTGSNFPLNFSSIILDAASTTEYNSIAGVNQVLYSAVNYGNLFLTNGSGTGSSIKSISSNLAGIAGNLTVNPYTTFDQLTYSANRSSTGGVFTLGANAIHKIAGNSGGQAGSNYPLNFATSTLNAASTTEYNSLAGIQQTIYAPVTYGNLSLTNSSGSGSCNKLLTANLTGIAGNLTINDHLIFDPAAYTCNRVASGGVLSLSALSSMRLSGSSGGQAGSNFPLNFVTISIDPASSIEYYGGAQSIFGAINYGNLVLAGSGTKTAPASLVLKGNFSKNTNTIFAHNNGQVTFSGSAVQQYSGVAPVVNFFNLINSNSVGLNIKSDMGVVKQLSLSGSSILNLSDTGTISIRSSALQTASVAVIPASASINYLSTGRFIVERFINSGVTHTKSWQLLSTPVQSESAYSVKNTWGEGGLATPGFGVWLTSPLYSTGNFDGYSPAPAIKVYNSVSNAYDQVTSSSSAISNKNGYFVYIRGDRTATPASGLINSTDLRTKGKIYDRSIVAPSTTVPSNAFATVGNPYASAIDLRQLRTNSVNLTGDIYIWDPTLGGQYGAGGYRTVSYVGSNYIINTVGGIYPNSIMNEIESGQAFFVKANPGGGIVQFDETVKVSGNKLITKQTSLNPAILRAALSAVNTGTETLLDGAMAIFDDGYSNLVDDEDAVKFSNSSNNISFKRDAKLLAVERRMMPVPTDTLAINTTSISARTYSWNITAEQMSQDGRLAWLWDKFLDIKTPLNLEGSTAVVFDVTSNPLSATADRFKIIFGKTATTLPVTFVSLKATRKADHTIAIDWKVENEINIARYDIDRSADGIRFTSILETAAAGGASVAHDYSKIDLSALPSANYYRIRAINKDGQIDYSNIVKVAAENIPASVSVYPNPVADHIMHLHFKNMPRGKYNIQLANKISQVISSAETEVTGLITDKHIKLNENVAAGTYQLTITDADGKTYHQQLVVE